jgi:SNF2 family DNA or RNA helicase
MTISSTSDGRDDEMRLIIAHDELKLLRGSDIESVTADYIFTNVFEVAESPAGSTSEASSIGVPDGIKFVPYPAELQADVSYSDGRDGSGLSLVFRASAEGKTIELASLQERVSDHVLIDGTWFPFAPGARDELLAALAEVGISDGGALSLRQYLALRQKYSGAYWLLDRTDASDIHPGINAAPPEGGLDLLTAKLYPYQQSGWQWLSYIHREGLGAILADEMGLGKTLQIIALLSSPDRVRVSPSLIVAPSTVMENWRREITRFSPSLCCFIHQGAGRTGDYRLLSNYDIIITSYDTIVRDVSMFRMLEWQVVVLDEAQAIKNPETKRAISVKALRRIVGIAVTGTPIENRLRDLWSLMDFAVPSYLGSLEDFERTFDDDADSARRIEPQVSPLMLRRRVIEVAKDLPPRIDIPQALTLSDLEAAEYEKIRLETLQQYGGAAALVALTRLRMFCAHPMLMDDVDWTGEQALKFSKFQRLFELIDEVFANNEKLLVFTSYNRVASLIKRTVRERYGLFAETVNGETPIPERQDVIDAFTNVKGPALLALNPRAAGAGLNITAATHVVHYNLEWNPAVEDQASARAYRRGQTRPVTIHRLFFANTVEEVVDDRLARKRELSETAVVGVEGAESDYADIARALHASPVRST